jgi:N-acetylglutamate synthase-like GNAT family acetyltransferase
MAGNFVLREASLADRDGLRQLIEISAKELSRGYYQPAQVAAALQGAFGVDTSLIEDGTYLVAERDGETIGCGGWSKRKTMFGGDKFATRDAALLDPRMEAARIRAFFVHPSAARQGIGRAILDRCETEAKKAGFTKCELMSTLPGVAFYSACGYAKIGERRFQLTDTIAIDFVPMTKSLAPNE